MTRYMEIALERCGARCVVQLADEEAPETCEAIWQALPLGGDVFHGKYARNEVYTLVVDLPGDNPGQENTTITPIPGDVCAFWFTAEQLGSRSHGYTEGRRPRRGTQIVDLAYFYERNNLLLNPDAGWVPGNVFGTIIDGLPEMATAAQELWLRGAAGERLTFARRT